MKNSLFVIFIIAYISSYAQDWTTQVACPNIPIVYNPFYDEDGDFIIPYQLISPPYANYNTGSTTVSQYLFDNNGGSNQYWGYSSLSVTWPYAGQAYIRATASNSENPDGWDVLIYVNVGSQPVFTSPPSLICNGQTGTFTISDICGTSYSWSAPVGWSINGGSNTLTASSKSVSITAPSTGNGDGQITVISNNSYGGSVSVNVWLGKPGQPVLDPNEVEMDAPPNRFRVSIIPPANQAITSYNWYKNSVMTTYHSSTSVFTRQSPYCGGSYSVQVVANNSCGTSVESATLDVYEPLCMMGEYSLIVSPNPATNEITVNLSDQMRLMDEEQVGNLIIVEQQTSSVVHSQKLLYEKTTIDVKNLRPGIYLIKVRRKGKSFEERLLIN